MPELLTVPQAATLARRSERWVLAHAAGDREPRLPAARAGARGYRSSWLFHRADILALLEAQKERSRPPVAPRKQPRPAIGRDEGERIIPGWHEAPEPCVVLSKTTHSVPCSVCGRRSGEMHDHGARIVCRACCMEGK